MRLWTERRVFTAALALLLCGSSALSLAYVTLPLVDWPQHVLQAAIVADLIGPRQQFADAYVSTDWFVPYQTVRTVQAALMRIFGVTIGAQLALLPYLAGLPLSVLALARRVGASPWAAAAAVTVLVDANFLWGFAPYFMAIPIVLLSICWMLDALDQPGARLVFAVGAAGVFVFFTHPIATGLCLGSAAVLLAFRLWADRRAWPAAVRIGLALAPTAALLGYYVISRGWIDGSAMGEGRGGGIIFSGVWERVLQIGRASGISALGTLRPIGYCACVAALIFVPRPDLARPRRRAADALLVLLASWTVAYLLLPEKVYGERLAPRFASFILLLGLLSPLPALRTTRLDRFFKGRARVYVGRGAAAIVFLAASLSLGTTHAHFARFAQRTRMLIDAAPLVDPNSRIANVVYSQRWSPAGTPAFSHQGAYLTAWRGGLSSWFFTKTGLDYAPTIDRSLLLLDNPRGPLHGWHMPSRVARAYDYILVRRGPRYAGHPVRTKTQELRLVRADSEFELWQVSEPHAR